MKKHVGYILGLVFFIQNGWGMNDQPRLTRSQSMSNINDKKKKTGKKPKVKTIAVTEDEDKQESEEKSSSTSENNDNHSDKPSSKDSESASTPAEVTTYTDKDLLKMFKMHQKNADVSVRYIREFSEDEDLLPSVLEIRLKDRQIYNINLTNGIIYDSEKKQVDSGIIKVALTKQESDVTEIKISINNQIHLLWNGTWLSVLDTSYDGSLAIEAPSIMTIGSVNCRQLYTKVNSAIGGGNFIKWGSLIISYEVRIFSENIRNIGYIGDGSKKSQKNDKDNLPKRFPTLEDIQKFHGEYSSVRFPKGVSNIGIIDVNSIRLANISLSSSGHIMADKVEQSGEKRFIRLGFGLHNANLQRDASIWKAWTDKYYQKDWTRFKTKITDLNTHVLSLDIKESIDPEIRNIEIEDAIDVKLTNPDTKVVSMSSETVLLSEILPDGVNKRDLQFDVSQKQAEDCFKLIYDDEDINAIEKTISLKNAKTNSEVQKLRMVVLNNKVSFFAKNGRKIDRIDAYILLNKLLLILASKLSDDLALELCLKLSDSNERMKLLEELRKFRTFRPVVLLLSEHYFTENKEMTVDQLKENLSKQKKDLVKQFIDAIKKHILNFVRSYI